MGKAKAEALAMIEAMPDDAAWEQIAYRILLRAKIEQAMAEIDAGQGIPHEQVMKEVSEWLSSSGHRPLAPTSEQSTTGSPAILS